MGVGEVRSGVATVRGAEATRRGVGTTIHAVGNDKRRHRLGTDVDSDSDTVGKLVGT